VVPSSGLDSKYFLLPLRSVQESARDSNQQERLNSEVFTGPTGIASEKEAVILESLEITWTESTLESNTEEKKPKDGDQDFLLSLEPLDLPKSKPTVMNQ
jgi:hypothetical protein